MQDFSSIGEIRACPKAYAPDRRPFLQMNNNHSPQFSNRELVETRPLALRQVGLDRRANPLFGSPTNGAGEARLRLPQTRDVFHFANRFDR
jgi:hypothetical protein